MDSKILALFCLFGWLCVSRVEGFFYSGQDIPVDFYLFTPRSPNGANGERITANNLNNINRTTFDPNLKLTVIVHGWLQNGFKPWITKMRKELMKRESMNVIVVNWEIDASREYPESPSKTRRVGQELAKLVNILHRHFTFNSTKVHVIGHSLGSHVAGFAGQFLLKSHHKKLGRITGLDPARPLFDRKSPEARLDPSDAEFVDVIHTDAGSNFLKGGLGLERISGHVDFYPNGGATQPGCSSIGNVLDIPRKIKNLSKGSSLPSVVSCDHMKAIDYFTSSINHQCSRKAFPCKNWKKFKKGRCFRCEGACPEMGYNADQYRVNGSHKFYLSTYNNAGYCAPRHYTSVVLSGLRTKRYGFWFLDTVVDVVDEKKIGISLVRQDRRTIVASPSVVEDSSQMIRLLMSDDQPGSLRSIVLSYSGRQEMYIGKATVRDDSNTYTACFNKWISSSLLFSSSTRYRASLSEGEWEC